MTESHVPARAGTQPATDLAGPPAFLESPARARGGAGAPADAGRPDGVPAIQLSGVVKEFHARGEVITAVRGLDLAIAEGEFFSLLGPSGCGKTTTMRMIAGFEEPTAGAIWLHGSNVTGIPPNKRDVNMVFQSYALFPHMSVFENVAFGLRRKKAAKDEITRRVGEMLEIVDLAGRGQRRPKELSGGQQQRVALARALVNRPRALLLDEPLGALDLKLRQAMQVELKRIQREVGITFVYVTHDQSEALTMSDRIAVMNDGAIEQLGAPREIYEHPKTRFVAGFIGTSNVLTGTVTRTEPGWAVIEVNPEERIIVPVAGRAVAAGSPLELTVRPEKIEIFAARRSAGPDPTAPRSAGPDPTAPRSAGPDPTAPRSAGPDPTAPPKGRGCVLRGTVSDVAYLGTSTNFSVTTTTGAHIVVFQQNSAAAGEVAAAPGDHIWLSWQPEHSYPIG